MYKPSRDINPLLADRANIDALFINTTMNLPIGIVLQAFNSWIAGLTSRLIIKVDLLILLILSCHVTHDRELTLLQQ